MTWMLHIKDSGKARRVWSNLVPRERVMLHWSKSGNIMHTRYSVGEMINNLILSNQILRFFYRIMACREKPINMTLLLSKYVFYDKLVTKNQCCCPRKRAFWGHDMNLTLAVIPRNGFINFLFRTKGFFDKLSNRLGRSTKHVSEKYDEQTSKSSPRHWNGDRISTSIDVHTCSQPKCGSSVFCVKELQKRASPLLRMKHVHSTPIRFDW